MAANRILRSFSRSRDMLRVVQPVDRIESAFASNQLFTWGSSLSGVSEPMQWSLASLGLHEADNHTSVPVSVAAGTGHSLFSLQVGMQICVFGLGLNSSGQLGVAPCDEIDKPQQLLQLKPNQRLKAMSCGRAHSALLLASPSGESLLTFGDNFFGQLGRSRKSPAIDIQSPVALPTEDRPKDVICGLDHTVILTHKGRVLTTGWNADGQLGNGSDESSDVFQEVSGLPPIVKVATKADMNLALTYDGQVYGWGNNEYGQHLISAKETRIPTPTLIPFTEKVFDIAVGGSFILLMTKSGVVYSCGYGLGLGQGKEVTESLTLQPVKGLPDGVVEIHAGLSYAIAVTASRDVYSWGLGRNGQLGLNDTENQFTAVKLPLPKCLRLLFFGCGANHVIASGVSIVDL